MFKDDKKHGRGEFRGHEGRIVIKGEWKDDKQMSTEPADDSEPATPGRGSDDPDDSGIFTPRPKTTASDVVDCACNCIVA